MVPPSSLAPPSIPRTKKRKRETGQVSTLYMQRVVMAPAAMDEALRDLLKRHGPKPTNALMKMLRVYPTHQEVRASLCRIGAVLVSARQGWRLPTLTELSK